MLLPATLIVVRPQIRLWLCLLSFRVQAKAEPSFVGESNPQENRSVVRSLRLDSSWKDRESPLRKAINRCDTHICSAVEPVGYPLWRTKQEF